MYAYRVVHAIFLVCAISFFGNLHAQKTRIAGACETNNGLWCGFVENELTYRKIPKISPSMYKPLQI